MNQLNKEQLEEIRKRTEAATEGPWKFCGNKWGDLAVYSPSIRAGMNNGGEIAELEGALLTDADFIANARQDIPALLDHIAELEAELAENKISFLSYEESQKDLARRCAERGVTKGYPLYDYSEEGDENDNV